jgi:DNA-binding IclR family transcriptional regulator
MKNEFPTQNGSHAPAVDRAFLILQLLGRSKEPLGVSAVSRAIGVGKSTVHGILQALLAARAIEDAGGRQYRLGPRVEELARSRQGRRTPAEICRPHLVSLVEQVRQTSMFGVPEGERFRLLSVVEGLDSFRVKAVQGKSIPLLAGVVGKIALAWDAVDMPEVLPRFTEDSVGDLNALLPELNRVRAEGLALDRGEYLRGVYAAASPVLKDERLVGILFSAGFQDQLQEEGLRSMGLAVARAARAVSQEFHGMAS